MIEAAQSEDSPLEVGVRRAGGARKRPAAHMIVFLHVKIGKKW